VSKSAESAVRGRLKPEYISEFYVPTLSEKYCNDNFEIDPKSLEVALEMIESTQSRAFAAD
jgi:hypothetical protein